MRSLHEDCIDSGHHCCKRSSTSTTGFVSSEKCWRKHFISIVTETCLILIVKLWKETPGTQREWKPKQRKTVSWWGLLADDFLHCVFFLSVCKCVVTLSCFHLLSLRRKPWKFQQGETLDCPGLTSSAERLWSTEQPRVYFGWGLTLENLRELNRLI